MYRGEYASTPSSARNTPAPYMETPYLRSRSPGLYEPRSPLIDPRLQQDSEMNIPVVKELSARVAAAQAKIIDLLEAQGRLHEEKAGLQNEVTRLQVERANFLQNQAHGCSKCGTRDSPGSAQPSTQVVAPTPAVPTANTSSPFSGAGQSIRPEAYPDTILWNLSDCKDFEIVSKTNQSRPNMEKCVRKQDGCTIEKHEYRSVKDLTRLIVHRDLIPLPCPNNPQAETTSRTKTWYRKYHFLAWHKAIADLERDEPLLTLCAAHWKATHMLGQCLQAIVDKSDTGVEAPTPKPDSQPEKRAHSELGDTDEDANGSAKRAHLEQNTSSDPSKTNTDKSKSRKKDNERKKKKKAVDGGSKERDTSAVSIAAAVSPSVELASLGATNVNKTVAKPAQERAVVGVNFIRVDQSFISLRDEFAGEFPRMSAASELLNAMEAAPAFSSETSLPSERMTAFVKRIETADPNAPELSEDDNNASWGHYQFTAGELTCSRVLTSWSEVGTCKMACALLAAALKTCKVAKFLCHERGITPTSYLSHIYLEQVVDRLLTCWKEAGGPMPPTPKEPSHPAQNQAAASTTSSGGNDPIGAHQNAAQTQPDKAELDAMFATLTKEIVKRWMEPFGISVKKTATKKDLVDAVLANLASISTVGFESLKKMSSDKPKKSRKNGV